MELNQMTDKPMTARNRKCEACGGDPAPKIDISIPGLNRLFDSSYERPKKIMWSVIMLVSATICVYLTVHQLHKFFEYPVASKTYKQALETVQFPSFSICAIYKNGSTNKYCSILEQEIKKKCQQTNLQNCEADFNSVKIHDLGIDLNQIWEKCHLKSIEVEIESIAHTSSPNDTNYVVNNTHFPLGSCVIVKHTGHLTYFSTLTRLRFSTKNEDIDYLIFLPHGKLEFNVQEYDYFKHEFDYLRIGSQTILKLQEEKFLLQNTSEKLCYDYKAERNRLEQKTLNKFLSSEICRLPFLRDNFPKCNTYDDVNNSITTAWNVITDLWSDDNATGRRACNFTNYAISIDYVFPLNETISKEVTTELIIKFTDDSIIVTEEYFSYSFPALVSDLFAFWGFFLCLSAFVFAEIFEFLIHKFYVWLTYYCMQK